MMAEQALADLALVELALVVPVRSMGQQHLRQPLQSEQQLAARDKMKPE